MSWVLRLLGVLGGPVSRGVAGFPRASESFVVGLFQMAVGQPKAVRMICQAVAIWAAQRPGGIEA